MAQNVPLICIGRSAIMDFSSNRLRENDNYSFNRLPKIKILVLFDDTKIRVNFMNNFQDIHCLYNELK